VSPKLRSLLARVVLLGGVALLVTFAARNAPHDQTLAIRLGNREVTRVEGSVTKLGDDEPTAGFSQVFPDKSPKFVRHEFRAATGTYIVVISFEEKIARTVGVTGDTSPNLSETSFERRVSLVGGEVIVSPD
jgi:hypothetical protein